ncbi:MAG TPA: SpoIIE family protein phosphatase [Candidatus Ozemobacteraceae bacterium]|nr:SpoIIE family protein phosphatase [Candidatus Ozemobacteraceae bacterium]
MLLASLLCGLAMAIHLALGVLVLMRAPRQQTNQCFSVLLFLFFVWSLAELLLVTRGAPQPGTRLVNLLLTPMFLLPPAFALFTALFPRRVDSAWQLGTPMQKLLVFAPAAVLLGILWSGRLIHSLDAVPGGFLISLGKLEYLAKGIVVGYLLLAMKTLGTAQKELETDFQERRLRYAFAAFVLPAAAGSVFIALGKFYLTGQTMYTFGLFPALGIAMAAILGYAILRHNLLEIDMIFSIGLVYTLLTAVLAGVLELLENGLQNLLDLSGGVATIVSTLVLAAVFSPLKDLIVAGVDKFFGRKSFDTAAVIRHVLNSMRKANSPDAVVDALLKELQPVLNFSGAAVTMAGGISRAWPSSSASSSASASAGIPAEWPPVDEIDALLEMAKETGKLEIATFVRWRELGFHWAFPIRREQSIQGAFLLAPKPGRLPYSEQERSLVSSLCQEIPPVFDTLALLGEMVSRDRASRELEWAESLYRELQEPSGKISFDVYDAYIYSSLAREIKGDLIVVENRAEHPFIAVCDAFHQGIAAAVTLHAVTAALRAAQPTDRLTPIHEILRRFTAPPLRTALTLVEPASGGLSLRLAGNPRPVVIRQGRPSECAGPKGEPLGVSQAASVERLSVDLEPGDLLIVSTNGLTKALSASGAAGFDGLTGPAAQGVEEVHAALQERLSGLPGLSTFPDDISYVIIQRRTHS